MNEIAGWLDGAYLWVKAAHVVFVIFYVAGLLILARHLAYQAATAPGSAEDRLWVERQMLLRKVILTPSLVAVWTLGLALGLHFGFSGGWLHLKILLVVLMTGFHHWMLGQHRKMAAGLRPTREIVYRRAGEIPAVLTVVIVILVIVKPLLW